jgi:hypothetical protein
VRRPKRWRVLAGAGGLGILLGATGCASASEPDVQRVAAAFENPSGDPQGRCALLTPATLAALESDASAPCAEAITAVPLGGGTVRAVEVWGDGAQVRLTADTVFLTETGTGWKVTAAGCEPRGEQPYDCEVEGP